MKVSEIVKLLDTEENKYGGATGKERELNLSINGDFVGNIKSAKLDGWGDGLITDVTLEVEVSSTKYHDEEIRNKAIDGMKSVWDSRVKDLIKWCKDKRLSGLEQADLIFDEIAEEMKGSEENEIN